MRLVKMARTVHANGETEIRYGAAGTVTEIESRKRAIPHSNRSGSWMHTSYFVIRSDGSEKEYTTLKDAIAAAEQ